MSLVTIKFDEPFITSAEVVGGYLDNDQLFLRFRNKDINPLAKWLCSLDTSIFWSVDGSDAYTRQRCPEENCMKTIVVSTGETEMDGLTVIRSHQTNIMYEKAWPVRIIFDSHDFSKNLCFTMIFNYSIKSTKFYYYNK